MDSKIKISQSEVDVMLCPEIIAATSRKKIVDLYVVWAAIRAIDKYKNGKGTFSTDDVSFIMEIILGVQKKYTYTLIKKGIDIFWSKPIGDRGKQRVFLIGMARVLERVQPEMTRTRPFSFKLYQLCEENRSSNLKSLLVGAVASRHSGERPVTIASIGLDMGMSRSTIKRRMRSCADIKSQRNYGKVHIVQTQEKANTVLTRLMNTVAFQGKKPFRVKQINSDYYILKQLANSYIMPEPRRLSLKYRPKELKIIDTLNSGCWENRKFHTSVAKAKPAGDVWFTAAERAKTDEGIVRLWDIHGNIVNPKIFETTILGARFGNWNALKIESKEIRELNEQYEQRTTICDSWAFGSRQRHNLAEITGSISRN